MKFHSGAYGLEFKRCATKAWYDSKVMMDLADICTYILIEKELDFQTM